MDIFIGNISYEATEEDLQSLMGNFGQVSSVTVIKNKHSGQSRGFGFVQMQDFCGASAIEALDGEIWMGRKLKVHEARPMRK